MRYHFRAVERFWTCFYRLSSADKALAKARARHVATYLTKIGLRGGIRVTTRQVGLAKTGASRWVNVTVRYTTHG